MYTDIRYGSAYRNPGGNNFMPTQDGEKKVDARGSFSSLETSTTAEDCSEKDVFSEVSSVHSTEAGKKEVFLGRAIEQVEASSTSSNILKATYRSSNRGAVTFGLAGGLVGGLLQGGAGVALGMSVGSSVGANLGLAGGVLLESYKSSDEETTNPEECALDASNNRFFGHVVELFDEAGHHAAVGSIGVGVGALVASLIAGNPLPVALHVAGVYSGATWAFGLTTGSAHWILQHLQQSEERLQCEQSSSPGDMELHSLSVIAGERPAAEAKVGDSEVGNN